MIDFNSLQQKTVSLCIVGLGYVGLPLAVHLAKHFSVIGFDINQKRIAALRNHVDDTGEVSTEELQTSSLKF